jgi:mannose-6-phosphate isomerase-like protein (cupin superfamily)
LVLGCSSFGSATAASFFQFDNLNAVKQLSYPKRIDIHQFHHGDRSLVSRGVDILIRAILKQLTEATTMKGFADDIEKLTEENDNFRRVLYTGKNIQLVLMALKPGEEIGEEVHDDRDQFFRFETGSGEVWIDDVANKVEADYGVIVPAGAKHNVVNTGLEPLRLYTIYGPPEHVEGTIQKIKAEAETSHEHFDGRTTE